jgi:hypothetical protein
MNTLDSPRGTRITLKIVKVVSKPITPDLGRSATLDYELVDADGWRHLWQSSHLARQPYDKPPHIPEGDGPLLVTATIESFWGWPESKGYILTRGRFSRGTGTAEPVEIVRHRW